MTPRSVEVDRLGAMDQLDSGAFGTVHRLSSYSLPGFHDLAYKEFTNVPSREEIANLTALVAFRSGLDARTRQILDDAAAWPLRVVTRSGAVCGFLMQLIPAEFFGQQILPSGRTTHLPIKAQWLVVDPAKADAAGIAVAREDDVPARLVLCAKLAHVFGVLHRAGLVYGDLSLNNLVFSAGSPPRVMLVDCDAVQAAGSAPIAQAHTPDWTPPECVAGSPAQDIATDRYKLALFMLRVLSPGPHASQAVDPARVMGVLDLEGNSLIEAGVSDDRSRRPSAKQWYEYLTRYLAVLTGPPTFASANVDSAAVMAGSVVTVSWRAAGADRIVITASDGHRTGFDATSGAGQCRIAVTRTGPFTLSAENRFGTTQCETRPVFVLQPPSITRIEIPTIALPPQPASAMPRLDQVLAGIRPELPGSPWKDLATPDLVAALTVAPPVPLDIALPTGALPIGSDAQRTAGELWSLIHGDVGAVIQHVRTASVTALEQAERGIGTSS